MLNIYLIIVQIEIQEENKSIGAFTSKIDAKRLLPGREKLEW